MCVDAYRKSAKNYDKFVEPLNAALRQIAMKLYPPREDLKVLEVGCGTGTNLELYHNAGCHVHGIDTSPAMIEQAKNKLGDRAELTLGSAAEMHYPENSFDLVICMLTLHEMPRQVRSQVINEIKRVLKKDGRLLIVDYNTGTLRFPKGWLYKGLITFFEVVAGREHFRNYRDYLSNRATTGLIDLNGLLLEKSKIVSGGNIGVYLVRI